MWCSSISNVTDIEQTSNLQFDNDANRSENKMEQPKDMNRILLNRLDEQQKYMKNAKIIMIPYMNSLRESHETKKLLLAAQEE